MNDMPVTTAIEHEDIAQQNEEAANSSAPLDAAASSQLIVTSGVQQSASDAEESPTQDTNDGENALIAAGSEEAFLGALSDSVEKDMLSRPVGDLSSDRSMVAAIKGFRAAFAVRYNHLLNGMANSTAEALRCLGDAEIHLADHIAQQNTPKVGE